MSDYITREEAKTALGVEAEMSTAAEKALEDAIDGIPTADVVEVTRCKDCYQSLAIEDVLYCTYWRKNTDKNGYCHEGG